MLTERYVKEIDTPKFYGMLASDIQYLVGGRAEVYYISRYGEVNIAVKNDIDYCHMSITLERYLKLKPMNYSENFFNFMTQKCEYNMIHY